VLFDLIHRFVLYPWEKKKNRTNNISFNFTCRFLLTNFLEMSTGWATRASGYEPTAFKKLFVDEIESFGGKKRLRFPDEAFEGISRIGRGSSYFCFNKSKGEIQATAPLIASTGKKLPTNPEETVAKRYVDTPMDLSVNHGTTYRNFVGELVLMTPNTIPASWITVSSADITSNTATLSLGGAVMKVVATSGSYTGPMKIVKNAPGNSGEVQLSYDNKTGIPTISFLPGDSIAEVEVLRTFGTSGVGNFAGTTTKTSTASVARFGVPGVEGKDLSKFPNMEIQASIRSDSNDSQTKRGVTAGVIIDIEGNGNPADRRLMLITKTLSKNGTAKDNNGNEDEAAHFDSFDINSFEHVTDTSRDAECHWFDYGSDEGLKNVFFIVGGPTGTDNNWTNKPLDLSRLTGGGIMPVTNVDYGTGYPNATIASTNAEMLQGSEPSEPAACIMTALHFQTGAATVPTHLRSVTAIQDLRVGDVQYASTSFA
jgi:hypothetical protein